MSKVNYLNNRDLLAEIHKSKSTYCSYVTKEDANYHLIVDDLKEVTDEILEETVKNQNFLMKQEQKKVKKNIDGATETIKMLTKNDIVIRVMTDEHLPNADPTTGKAKRGKQKVDVNFTPFKHFKFKDGEFVEVGRSHWTGPFDTGHFSQSHGKVTNKLALMFMTLVERYGQKSNWRGYCVDEATEALTQRGWLGINEINEQDMILSYRDGNMKWSKIKSIYRGDFDGYMHYLTMTGVDMLITPNHKLMTNRGLIPVELLNQKDQIILMGGPVDSDIENIHTDDFVELVGWVMTKGCYDVSKDNEINSITLYPNPGPQVDRVRNCLNSLEYKFNEKVTKGNIAFKILKGSLEHITTRLPERKLNVGFIVGLTSEQREKLINTMINGNETIQQGNNRSYCHTDKENISLFQMLCTISGYRIKTDERVGLFFGKKTSYYSVNLYPPTKNKTLTSLLDFHGGMNNGKVGAGLGKDYHPHVPTTYYKGQVWCPETEYGCFVARRNNTIYLTGNTYNDEMKNQALLQLSSVCLQFNEARSSNPFAYYTRIVTNAFTRILNLEKKVQKLRDDMLIMYGATPSFTRQVEHEQSSREMSY